MADSAERRFRLTLPVLYDETPIASIEAAVSADGGFEASRSDISKILGLVLSAGTLAEVEVALGDAQLITPAEASQAGFAIVFDPRAVALRLTTTRDARRETDLSLTGFYDNSAAFENSPPPADVSAFLNMTGGARIDTGPAADQELGLLVGGDGAIRAADFVLKGGFFYDGTSNRFEFGSAQLVRDIIPLDIRATAGDIATAGTELIGGVDLVGLSLSHRPGQFGRRSALSPVTAQSFDLDRSSTVSIYVNGDLRRTIRLAPGRYNLSSFGLSTGANDIRIVATDERGVTEETLLSSFSDAALLPAGLFTWEASAGSASDQNVIDLNVDTGEPVFAGRLEYGLSDQISAGTAALIRDNGQVASVSMDTATPVGFFGLDAAGSRSDGKTGSALSLDYRPYLPDYLDAPGRSLSFSAFAASESFSTIAAPGADSERYAFAARYSDSFEIFGKEVGTSLFGSYGRTARDDQDFYSAGANIGFGFGDAYRVSISPRYERDTLGDREFSVFLSLSRSFGGNFAASASYDSGDNAVLAAGAYRNQFGGVGTINASLAAARSDFQSTQIAGTADYTGNRFTAAASHVQQVEANVNGGLGSTSSLTVSTGLVFADGKLAITRPVSDSFAIVSTHPSLGDTDVVLSPGQRSSGDGMRSDRLGPLVASSIASYSVNSIEFEAGEIPLGYDLGPGVFDIAGPLNAGYVLEIGSDRSASAIGRIVGRDGTALAYAAGTVSSPDDAGFQTQSIFTNRAGRFGVFGLVPGKTYAVQMAGGALSFSTKADSYGLNDVGIFTLSGQ